MKAKILSGLLFLIISFASFAVIVESVEQEGGRNICNEHTPVGERLACLSLHYMRYAITPQLVSEETPFEAQLLFLKQPAVGTSLQFATPRQELTITINPDSILVTTCGNKNDILRLLFLTYEPVLYSKHLPQPDDWAVPVDLRMASPVVDTKETAEIRGKHDVIGAKGQKLREEWCGLISRAQDEKRSFTVLLEFMPGSNTVQIPESDIGALNVLLSTDPIKITISRLRLSGNILNVSY